MRYTVVEANSARELTRYVEDLLKIGWKLQGGVVVLDIKYPLNQFYQAMYKDGK